MLGRRWTALTLLLLTSPAISARKPVISWGKADVTFEQYRIDSVECGRVGAGRSMKDEEAYKTVVLGLERQDTDVDQARSTGMSLEEAARAQALTTQRAQFSRNIGRLQGFLVSGVERCLIDRGYTPFRLTAEQTRALARYRTGTQERFHFLHSLAADADVLAAQKAEDAR